MDLEERTIEQLPDSCQNCGTTLTDAEKQAVLESVSGVALCTTCAAEQVSLDEEAVAEEEL